MVTKKRKLQVNWRIDQYKIWQLIILLILSALISVSFLRINNIGMIERRNAVIEADKAEAESDSNYTQTTHNRLVALQRYTADHMNASTGPLYLSGEYQRDVELAVEKASNNSTIENQNVVQEADRICRERFAGYWQGYVQCNLSEQSRITGADSLDSSIDFPNPDLYKHEFVSPVWSPDFAGFSVLISVLLAFMIIMKTLSHIVIKLLVRRHYSGI